MSNSKNPVDGVRSFVRETYWKLEAGPLGKWVPSPQVIGAAVGAFLAQGATQVIPGYAPPPGLTEVVAALAVAYWIGPEPVVEFEGDLALVEPPNDGGTFQEPTIDGTPVGPDPEDQPPVGQV